MTIVFEDVKGFRIAWCTVCACMLHADTPEKAENIHQEYHRILRLLLSGKKIKKVEV